MYIHASKGRLGKGIQGSEACHKNDKAGADFVRFLKFLKKDQKIELQNLSLLDIGCGTGKNSIHFSELGNTVSGIDISSTAITIAQERAREKNLQASFTMHDIGSSYPFPDNSFDIAIDVTSSNSLDEKSREIYLKETQRVLKSGGYFFVKALCKEGDQNAKHLLKENPGTEKDTYIMKDLGLTERVWEKTDFVNTYSAHFTLLTIEKKTSYTRFNNRVYKRNFWIAYLKKE